MCRAFVIVALSCAAVMSVTGPAARAAEPTPPATPFIDSGNDLPDLDARAREMRAREAAERDAKLGPRQWYGWQILVADAAVAGCLSGTRQALCLLAYPFSGPAIHLANGHPGRAGLSLGLRLGLSSVAAGIARSRTNCPDGQPTMTSPPSTGHGGDPVNWNLDWGGIDGLCGLDDAAKGALIGAAVAALIDAAIAFRRTGPEATKEPAAPPPRVIEPQMSFVPGGFNVGLGARF